MKTMKKLQVAAAVGLLLGAAGVAQSATLNSTGTVFAIETIKPDASGDLSKVRAPAYTYSYQGGITVGGSSVQHFQIASTLVNAGRAEWAFNDTTDPLVPFFDRTDTAGLAQTTLASLRGVGNGRRVAVVSTDAQIPQDSFGIVLRRVVAGDAIAGSPNNVNTSTTRSVTYIFELVNKTGNSVTLSGLDLTFNTSKTPDGTVGFAAADPASGAASGGTGYATGSAVDTFTTGSARYASLFKLTDMVNASIGHDRSAGGCYDPKAERIGIQVFSGEGVVPTLGPEPNQTNVAGAGSTTIGNYLSAARALDIIVGKNGDRLIQTTNSFQTNLGSSPVNGVGGTGGGRFTFKPSNPGTVVNPFGGSGIDGAGNALGTGIVNLAPAAGAAPNANLNPPVDGFMAYRAGVSRDELNASLGTITFSNRPLAVLDRLLDVDAYRFDAGTTPTPSTSPLPSGAADMGDFLQPNGGPGAPANVFGGVDVATGAAALTITLNSKPNFTGFVGNTINNNVLFIVKGDCSSATPRINATPANFVQGAPGAYTWSVSNTDLSNAAGGTLSGGWSVCYTVPGNVNIPATFFSNVVVTLNRDDATEQISQSCPGNLASIYGGVKIDVRNFQLHRALPNANADQRNWFGVLRLINNSESETATVEGQFIHQDGKYGPWGQLAVLPPRASQYVFASTEGAVQGVYGLLSNPVANATSEVNNDKPLTETARIRISADVSTLRVQNYVYHAATQALTEVSSAQGADFVNVDSANRDHIDQDAQFDIVKDAATLTQRPNRP